MTLHDQIKRGRELCEKANDFNQNPITRRNDVVLFHFYHEPEYMKQLYDLLDKAVEVIKFYGEITNYHTHYSQILTPSSDANMIIRNDLQEVNAKDGSYKKMIGGKRAREFLAGLDGENEKT